MLTIAETPPLQFRGIRAYFISRRMRRDARHRREHTSALRLSNPRCSYFCSFKSDCNYSRNQWSKRCRLFRRVSRALTLPCDRWLCSRHRRFFDSLLLITGSLCFLNVRLEISVRYCLTRWLKPSYCRKCYAVLIPLYSTKRIRKHPVKNGLR